MSHPRLQAGSKAPPPMTARRFFDEICPAVFRAREVALRTLGGRFLFLVRGEGAWLLDFGRASVEALWNGADVGADLAIRTDGETFTAMMKGTLDVPSAVAQSRISVAGNAGLFPNLSAAFRPAV
jgi:hypothetical protein